MIELKKMLILLACCVCLVVARTSRADFVGVVSEIVTDARIADLCGEANGDNVPFPLTVCNVFVQFDEDDDRMLSVVFSDLQVMNRGVPDVLYQHIFGEDLPSWCALVVVFSDLVCDSYVTIGQKCRFSSDGTSLDADFDSSEFNWNGHIVGGWFNNPATNGQGDAVNYADGKVLIMQLSVAAGSSIEGTARILWQKIGDPTLFDPDVEIVCEAVPACRNCPTDANGDGETGPFDLAALLGAWGPLKGNNCQDADDNGEIGAFDLANLLAAWGPCP